MISDAKAVICGKAIALRTRYPVIVAAATRKNWDMERNGGKPGFGELFICVEFG
jgi:hypothetical protein